MSIDSEINKIDALTPFFDSPNYFHSTYNNQLKLPNKKSKYINNPSDS
jgi:hypothetical protein